MSNHISGIDVNVQGKNVKLNWVRGIMVTYLKQVEFVPETKVCFNI